MLSEYVDTFVVASVAWFRLALDAMHRGLARQAQTMQGLHGECLPFCMGSACQLHGECMPFAWGVHANCMGSACHLQQAKASIVSTLIIATLTLQDAAATNTCLDHRQVTNTIHEHNIQH